MNIKETLPNSNGMVLDDYAYYFMAIAILVLVPATIFFQSAWWAVPISAVLIPVSWNLKKIWIGAQERPLKVRARTKFTVAAFAALLTGPHFFFLGGLHGAFDSDRIGFSYLPTLLLAGLAIHICSIASGSDVRRLTKGKSHAKRVIYNLIYYCIYFAFLVSIAYPNFFLANKPADISVLYWGLVIAGFFEAVILYSYFIKRRRRIYALPEFQAYAIAVSAVFIALLFAVMLS